MKTTPFMIASRKITNLEIKLTQEVKDLHNENYSTKEIEEDIGNGNLFYGLRQTESIL